MTTVRPYNVNREYVNIENYSPFCRVNEVSPKYQRDPFRLPVVRTAVIFFPVPVHPDTFNDLQLNPVDIVEERDVFPTSSFRTVYDPYDNLFLKLPILRRITRGLRDLPYIQLDRSRRATEMLTKFPLQGFSFLPEECHYAASPNFNFIKREIPDADLYPWFYVIKTRCFDKKLDLACAINIIRSWLFYASHRIFLEYHTQNILVDPQGDLYYRDLSDVNGSRPKVLEEMLALVFDRTVCSQNIDHLFRYRPDWGSKEQEIIKDVIKEEIAGRALPFPNYSMGFPSDATERIPVKISLSSWRDFS